MNFSANNARASKLWFDEDSMWIALCDGRVLSVPKTWFPRLSTATEQELLDYEFSGHGLGIHWDCLDEDISVPALLMGNKANNAEARHLA